MWVVAYKALLDLAPAYLSDVTSHHSPTLLLPDWHSPCSQSHSSFSAGELFLPPRMLLTPVFHKPGSFLVIQITASKRAFLAFESKVTQTCNRTSPQFLSIAIVSDIFLICIPVFVFLRYSFYGEKRELRLLPTMYVPPSIVLGIYMSHSTNIYWMRKGKKIELPVDGRSSKIRGLIKS